MPEILAENIDRLCTIEMRPKAGNLPRGYIDKLYAAARERAGKPLTLGLAQDLIDRVGNGERVLIMTGAGCPPFLPRGEVDGLLGAAALARALNFGLGAEVSVLGEPRNLEPLRAACQGAGMNFAKRGEETAAHTVIFVPTPIEDEAWRREAIELLDETGPSAVIAIEKLSPNVAGAIHNATGHDYSHLHARPEYLFDEAEARGILTAGIGDGGNEVGFGGILETVREVVPRGRVCECPCGSGLAARVATDHLLVGAISNWSSYGVAALLLQMVDRLDALVTPDDVARMLRGVVDAGAFDGVSGRPTLSDDGAPIEVQRAFMTMLHGLVANGSRALVSPSH